MYLDTNLYRLYDNPDRLGLASDLTRWMDKQAEANSWLASPTKTFMNLCSERFTNHSKSYLANRDCVFYVEPMLLDGIASSYHHIVLIRNIYVLIPGRGSGQCTETLLALTDLADTAGVCLAAFVGPFEFSTDHTSVDTYISGITGGAWLMNSNESRTAVTAMQRRLLATGFRNYCLYNKSDRFRTTKLPVSRQYLYIGRRVAAKVVEQLGPRNEGELAHDYCRCL